MMRKTAKAYSVLPFSLLLCLIVAAAASGGPLTIGQQATPDPVARGEILTFAVAITNTGAATLTDLMFQDPLPTGIDQLNAEYRLNAGGWMAYPVNGIIPLGTIDGGNAVSVEIQARVEHSAPGSLSNTATVADNTGTLASATLVTNILPSVDAGADKMVGLSCDVILSDASAGDGGDGIALYSWSDNGGGGSFDDPNALHPTYTAPVSNGLLTLTLTVTDHQGGQASDALRVRVNAFPTVDAGADRSVDEGASVTLSDAVASDSDGWITSILWDDHGAGGTFSPSPNVINPSYTAPVTQSCNGEDLTLTLTVTDNWGAQASDTITVHVNNVNTSPSADAGADRTVQEAETVILIGSGSDPDGQIVSFAWEQLSGPAVTLSEPNTAQPRFVTPAFSANTTFRFRLTVTDNCGASATDEVEVTVEPSIPPGAAEISVIKAADRSAAALGDRITYTYTVTNTGEVTLYEVRLTDDKLGDLHLGLDRLAAGETTTATAVATVAESDLPGPLVNTATAAAQDETGTPVTAVATASVELVEPSIGRSSIEVEKEAQDSRGLPLSPFSPLSLGDTITYVITVTNTGETMLTDIVAVDNHLGAVPLDRITLSLWESTRGALEKTIAESDLPGPLKNTVIVTAATPDGQTVTDSDTLVLLGISGESALELRKEADSTDAAVGDTITYTYTIINAGDVTITDLELIDDQIGEVPLPTRVLGPGESITVTAAYVVSESDLPGPLTNSAKISGIGLEGTTAADEISVSVFLSEVPIGGGGALEDTSEKEEQVIINEIAWAGTPVSPSDEWIELRNLGTMPVDLSGWCLCWYQKGETVPDQDLWHRIELSGFIEASPIDLSVRRRGRPEITFLKRKGDAFSWQVFDMSWWVAGKVGPEGRGYYLLERRHDKTVSNVLADLIYDVRPPYALKLPDEGAVMLLLNANGEVVDRANSEYTERAGWVAGDARTCATMERTEPFTGDIGANWHTNPRILIYGLDSAGNRLVATAGKPNSLDLTELTLLAENEVSPHPIDEQIHLTLREPTPVDRPWIQVATPQPEIAGGGGGLRPTLSFSSYDTEAGLQLEISTEGFPPGTYYVWIAGEEGEAILLPFIVHP